MNEMSYHLKRWDESGKFCEPTIEGRNFIDLVNLCFEYATYFSLKKSPWIQAQDSSLEKELQPYLFKQESVDHWYCYGAPPEHMKNEVPLMKISIYHADKETKKILLQYIHHLFIWEDERTTQPTLQDLCFFQGDRLFLGTVSHEYICSVISSDAQFIKRLLLTGEWDYSQADCLEFLSLNEGAM